METTELKIEQDLLNIVGKYFRQKINIKTLFFNYLHCHWICTVRSENPIQYASEIQCTHYSI